MRNRIGRMLLDSLAFLATEVSLVCIGELILFFTITYPGFDFYAFPAIAVIIILPLFILMNILQIAFKWKRGPIIKAFYVILVLVFIACLAGRITGIFNLGLRF